MSKVFNMVGGGGVTASIFVTGLSQTDTVTATKGSKTLTGKWTHKPNPAAHGLPDGYTELEYIESSGTQWIDTGLRMPYFRIKATAEVVSFTNDWQLWFGYSYDDARAYLGLSNTNKFCIGYPISNGYVNNIKDASVGVDYEIDVSIGQASATYIVNGDTLKTVSYTASVGDRPIALFADANSGTPTASEFNNIRFKGSTQIYDQSDVLVGHFIPCKRNSDSAVGMYNLISGAFLPNAGTGEFVAGPEISQTIDGHLIQPIRDFGTWTVTATDGTDTYTQDVLVDVITNYEIEISKKLYLYRDGNECEDITGGWVFCPWPSSSYYANGTMTKNDTSILLSSNAVQFAGARPSNKIDLTDYSKIVFIVDSNTKSGKYSYSALDVYSSLSAFGGANRDAYVDISSGQTGIFEVDISSVSGSKYIVCYASADNSSSSTLQFTGMYLI